MGSNRIRGALAGLSVAAGLAIAGQSIAADLTAKRLPPEAAPAPAQTPLIDFVFGARIQSDYNFRGISQSDHRESGQTYFEAQYLDNLFYTGFATAKVDLPTRPAMEFDLTAGIRPKWGPLTFDLGVIYYNYPGERALFPGVAPANTDFLEFAAKASWAVNDAFTLGANVFYAGNWLGTHADGTYVSGTAKYVIPTDLLGVEGFAVSGEFGHYFLGRTAPWTGGVGVPTNLIDYNYGNVGVSYTWRAFTLDVRGHFTDLNKTECFINTGDPRGVINGTGRSNWCGDAVVATLSLDLQASKIYEQLGLDGPGVPR
ncbi:TorF family putative porin [Enterovirga aerilata]|uniref:Porin n=1 Tax=Enterovirga aerilata TaxID=2730920 RepID=A0A849I840_9HYPH|nr:TorF family putative porin [Enterovirga sp. DB1703]NNM73558.1 hypothetical protein [Enterovirga sp. DB1703]